MYNTVHDKHNVLAILPLLMRCRTVEEEIEGPEEKRDQEIATGPLSLLIQVRRWSTVAAVVFHLVQLLASLHTAEVIVSSSLPSTIFCVSSFRFIFGCFIMEQSLCLVTVEPESEESVYINRVVPERLSRSLLPHLYSIRSLYVAFIFSPYCSAAPLPEAVRRRPTGYCSPLLMVFVSALLTIPITITIDIPSELMTAVSSGVSSPPLDFFSLIFPPFPRCRMHSAWRVIMFCIHGVSLSSKCGDIPRE